jgi:predicted amidohydrolase YtcJ
VAGITYLHGYDESAWDLPGLPGLAELDTVPHAIVLTRADAHVSLANTAALLQSGAMDLPGIERDDRGEPTGLASQQANDRLQQWYTDSLSSLEIEELQLQAAASAAALGITTVHEMSMPSAHGTRDFDVLAAHAKRLPVDVVAFLGTTDLAEALDRGLSRVGGDLALDGSIGARTAHMAEPYVGGGHGVAYHDDEELFRFLSDAHVSGLQVGLHVIGDAAIEQALVAWERVYGTLDSRQRRHFRARRHRLEHCELPTQDQIERIAMLGLAASVQPSFDAAWGHPGGMYEQRLGEGRAMRMNPFHELVQRGIAVGAGSDSPITPLDPMQGIEALERHHDPSQRLAREDAFRLFTRGGARLAHQEDKKGHLEPGSHADLAAYDADPLDPSSGRPRPILTLSLGREVHAS